jgi:ribonuclease I
MYKFVSWQENEEESQEVSSFYESRTEATSAFKTFVHGLNPLDNAAARVEDEDGRILFSVTYFNQTW